MMAYEDIVDLLTWGPMVEMAEGNPEALARCPCCLWKTEVTSLPVLVAAWVAHVADHREGGVPSP